MPEVTRLQPPALGAHTQHSQHSQTHFRCLPPKQSLSAHHMHGPAAPPAQASHVSNEGSRPVGHGAHGSSEAVDEKKLADPRLTPDLAHGAHRSTLLELWPHPSPGSNYLWSQVAKRVWSQGPVSGPKVPPQQLPGQSPGAPGSCPREAESFRWSHTAHQGRAGTGTQVMSHLSICNSNWNPPP